MHNTCARSWVTTHGTLFLGRSHSRTHFFLLSFARQDAQRIRSLEGDLAQGQSDLQLAASKAEMLSAELQRTAAFAQREQHDAEARLAAADAAAKKAEQQRAELEV